MNKSHWLPFGVIIFLIALGGLMAFTDLFQPLIQFIHNQDITPLQAVACIFGALVGFYFVFHLLVRLGAYFLPDE